LRQNTSNLTTDSNAATEFDAAHTVQVPRLMLSLLAGLPIWAWCHSRSPLQRKHQLWYEDAKSGHAASPTLVLLGWLLEVVYVACSLGIGALVSLVMRCLTPSRQSLGERLAGVRLIVERVSPL
jgi:hypothetical protein